MANNFVDLYVNEKSLHDLIITAILDAGMNKEDAETLASLLIKTEKWGIHTHGLKNLAGYIAKSKVNGVSFTNKPFIVKSLPSAMLVDANNTLGFISSSYAMNEAMKMADKTGIGLVVVRNSCHYGAGICYGDIASSKGYIGIVMSNVDKKMAIPGTIGMTMGHNPFTLCAPSNIVPSVCLDTSSSMSSSLKVIAAKQRGEKIPFGWIIDKDGKPTDDPSHYPEEGALLPMAYFKGYGIAFFVDILTGVLGSSLNSVSDDIPSWCFDLEKPNSVSHTFIAINAEFFVDDIRKEVDRMILSAKDNKKAVGVNKINVPGEDMWERYHKADKDGKVYLPQDVVAELAKIIDINKLEQ